jgi:enoyl-CoA hydratase/3-hydroxyacyl-CoA dehydrogenase
MTNIKNIAVIGAGTMGSAIAQHFLIKGMSVHLLDQDRASMDRGCDQIFASMDEAKSRGIINTEQAAQMFECLTLTEDVSVLAGDDLVVEAIFEDLQAKQELFKSLEDTVSQHCILASNTSSLQISDLQQGLRHPQRMVGVHYFYHAAKNKLVEIVPGSSTDPALVDRLLAFYNACGKTPIVVADTPGFAVNRFFVPWLNEAVRLYQEGLGSIPLIDQVARETFGVGMGPFALMNATGVPIAMHAADGLAAKLGKFYAPAERLIDQVDSSMDWDLDGSSSEKPGDTEQVRQRLLGASIGVACQLVSEGVADATSVDLGARVGLRWPKGPFEMLNEIGVSESRAMVTALFEHWNLPLPAVPFADDELKPVRFDWVQASKHQNTGLIVFNLPDRMNALGEIVMEQLSDCFADLEADSEIQNIYFAGKGKAFVAGADIKFFLDAIDSSDLDRIVRFTEAGQQILQRISASEKTTVAYLDGLTIGGGLELALACDYRIGTNQALLGYPETGIGIYPGLGGTQRTPRLIGKNLAKLLIATGKIIDATTARQFGLLDLLIEPVQRLSDLAEINLKRCHPLSAREPSAAEAFADFDGELSEDWLLRPEVRPFEKSLRRKAPIALRTAVALIDRGASLPLDQALELELEGLLEIFSTQDARAGLDSVLSHKPPHFTGH